MSKYLDTAITLTINATGVALIGSTFLLGLHLFCPSEAQWRQIDAMYAAAEKRHEFICVYVANTWPDLLRGTAFNVWVHQPATVTVALIVFTISALLFGAAYLIDRSGAIDNGNRITQPTL